MKLTKSHLKQIIKEELQKVLNESLMKTRLTDVSKEYDLGPQRQPWVVQDTNPNEWAKRGIDLAASLLDHVEDIPEYALWLLSAISGKDLCAQITGPAEDATEADSFESDMKAIMQLDGDAVRRMLRHVDARTLTTAVSTYPEGLRDHILSSLSVRAATIMIEDIKNLGPVSENQAREAHGYVMEAVAKLAEESDAPRFRF